ncbi:TPA: helix-turn-helix domain-containing protein [Salmonella enterica subsp. diarizonae serovar 61:r:-]
MCDSTLASRVKERRKALGLTQTTLAERAGMRQQSVQYLESGAAKGTSFILELARALECDPVWLKYGTPDGKA